jgi:hypothetical protein
MTSKFSIIPVTHSLHVNFECLEAVSPTATGGPEVFHLDGYASRFSFLLVDAVIKESLIFVSNTSWLWTRGFFKDDKAFGRRHIDSNLAV